VEGKEIYSTSADGVVKVFEFSSGSSLRLIHDSEDVKGKSGGRICCITVSKETMYVGTEGANIRAVDWRSGTLCFSAILFGCCLSRGSYQPCRETIELLLLYCYYLEPGRNGEFIIYIIIVIIVHFRKIWCNVIIIIIIDVNMIFYIFNNLFYKKRIF